MKDLNCLESEFAKKSFKDVFDGLLSNSDSVEGLILSKDAKTNQSVDGCISELKRKVAEVLKDKTSGLDILDEKARDYISNFSTMKSKMDAYAEGFNPDIIGQWLAISDTSIAPNGFILPVAFSAKDHIVKCIPGKYQRDKFSWRFLPDDSKKSDEDNNNDANVNQTDGNQEEQNGDASDKQERKFVEIPLDDFNSKVIENIDNKKRLADIEYMNSEDAMNLAFRVNKKTDALLKSWVFEHKDDLPFVEYMGAVLGLSVLDTKGNKIGYLVKSKGIFVAKNLEGKKIGISTGRPGSKVIKKDKDGNEVEIGVVADYSTLTDHNFNTWYDSILNKDKLLKLFKFEKEDHWSIQDIRNYMIKMVEDGYFDSYDPSVNIDKSGKTYEGLVAMPSDTSILPLGNAGSKISSEDPKYDGKTTYSVNAGSRNYVNAILMSSGIDSREMTKPILLKTKKVLGHKSNKEDYVVYKLSDVITPHPVVWNAANNVIEYSLGYGNRESFDPDNVLFKLNQIDKANGRTLILKIGDFRRLLASQDSIDPKVVANYALKYRNKLTAKDFSAWSTFRLTPDVIKKLLMAYMLHNESGKAYFPFTKRDESIMKISPSDYANNFIKLIENERFTILKFIEEHSEKGVDYLVGPDAPSKELLTNAYFRNGKIISDAIKNSHLPYKKLLGEEFGEGNFENCIKLLNTNLSKFEQECFYKIKQAQMSYYDKIAQDNRYHLRGKDSFEKEVAYDKNKLLNNQRYVEDMLKKGYSKNELNNIAENQARDYVTHFNQINVIKIYEEALAKKSYSPFVTRALNAICNVNPKEATYMVKPAVNGKGAGGGYGYSIINLRSGFDPEDIGQDYQQMPFTSKLQRTDKQM